MRDRQHVAPSGDAEQLRVRLRPLVQILGHLDGDRPIIVSVDHQDREVERPGSMPSTVSPAPSASQVSVVPGRARFARSWGTHQPGMGWSLNTSALAPRATARESGRIIDTQARTGRENRTL